MSTESKTVLIVLNGYVLQGLPLVNRDDYGLILATDGSFHLLRDGGWLPDVVFGDFDSISTEGLGEAKLSGVRIVHAPDQDHTDFEKALAWLAEGPYDAIDVIGHRGGRLDHALGALCSAGRFSERFTFRFLDPIGTGFIVPPGKPLTIESANGRLCSVLGLWPSQGVSLDGFRWPLHDGALGGEIPQSISNEIATDRARIEVREGLLFVYLHRYQQPGER